MSADSIQTIRKIDYSKPPLRPRREILWLQEGKKCHWCGDPTRLTNDHFSWDQATIEHIIPRYKGGTNDPNNLVSACRRCNNRRSHEDQCGLPDGHLLGKYKTGPASRKLKHTGIALTKDDKKALLQGSGSILVKRDEFDACKDQRDKALKTIIELRADLKQKDEIIYKLKNQFHEMTISNFIRKRVISWILTKYKDLV